MQPAEEVDIFHHSGQNKNLEIIIEIMILWLRHDFCGGGTRVKKNKQFSQCSQSEALFQLRGDKNACKNKTLKQKDTLQI